MPLCSLLPDTTLVSRDLTLLPGSGSLCTLGSIDVHRTRVQGDWPSLPEASAGLSSR